MRESEYIIDETGAVTVRPPIWRYVTCTGDWERHDCRTTIRQTRQPNGIWRPWFCGECDAAWDARQASESTAA